MSEKILNFLSQYFISAISIALTGVLFWAFSPDDSISVKTFMWYVIPLGLYAIIAIPQQFKYWEKAHEVQELPTLKIIKDGICIFTPSSLFSQGCFVSVFYLDEYEKMIGYGKVDTIIHETKLLQVSISEFNENYNLEFMTKNRKNIILKPTCPFEKIMTLFEHLNQGEQKWVKKENFQQRSLWLEIVAL